jgi:DNA polymerase-3 subunit delta
MAFYLVHGSDEGLIRERARALVASLLEGDIDSLRLIRFDGDVLAREPGTLAEEADAVSMFGGHRVIWIEMKARDIAPALEPLFKQPPRDCAIVVEAGSLKKGHALRSAFEKMSPGASIECYPDDRRSLAALIEAEAREANIRIPPDVRDYLIEFLGSDRMTTRAEVAKLLLYAAGNAEVSIDDVEAIVSDAAPSQLDDALDSAFLGDNSGMRRLPIGFSLMAAIPSNCWARSCAAPCCCSGCGWRWTRGARWRTPCKRSTSECRRYAAGCWKNRSAVGPR